MGIKSMEEVLIDSGIYSSIRTAKDIAQALRDNGYIHKSALIEARIDELHHLFSHGWFHLSVEEFEKQCKERVDQFKKELLNQKEGV